jgi:hypothetical protein
MTSRLFRGAGIALVLACLFAAGCQDRQRPKPVTQQLAAAAAATR